MLQGLPCGPAVRNLPAIAEDKGSIPDLGRSHMPQGNEMCALQQMSLYSRAWELQLLSPGAAATEALMP